jgi:hypothetical protein
MPKTPEQKEAARIKKNQWNRAYYLKTGKSRAKLARELLKEHEKKEAEEKRQETK